MDKKMIDKQEVQDQINAFKESASLTQESSSLTAEATDILKQQIISQPEQELTLEEMSNQVFISKYYLLRQFKEKVGLTPHYFQIQNRIRKAKQLLQQDQSMAAVAIEMGFYDQSHFIHYFQKFTGITPQEYLESIVSLEEE